MRWILVLSVLALNACAASVIPAFEAAKKEALRNPGPAPDGWRPDAVVRMSNATVDQALIAILRDQATLDEKLKLPLGTLKPSLAIDGIHVSQADRCGECLQVAVDLEGSVRVETAIGATRLPLDGSATLDVALAVERVDQSWQITVDPRGVKSVKLGVGGVSTGIADLAGTLKEWVDDNLVSGIGPQPLADLGDGDMPFRAVRVVPGDGSVEIRMLTEAGADGSASIGGSAPKHGWSLEMTAPSLLALARRASMSAEPLEFDIVAEPTRLSVDGDTFELGLRLWRVSGRGWWRDYTITGAVEAKPKKVVLVPTDVRQDGSSPGAALVDPLAFLGQGVILNTIESALNTSMPASRDEKVGGLNATLGVSGVRGAYGSLVVDGTLELSERAKGSEKPSSGGKRRR
ncbi:MAG: hypothetical protein ACI8PZ_002758 [Myxococcota bacterium]